MACALLGEFPMLRSSRWRWLALVIALALGLAYAVALLGPRQYIATGGVLLPTGMARIEYAADDGRSAAAAVQAFIASHPDARLVDRPLVVRQGSPSALYLLGALLLGVIALLGRRKPAVARSETALIRALGAPLVAARPLAAEALARQLVAQWFGRGRTTLAVVSARKDGGRTRAAAELARALARMGEPTLLIDADFRTPGLHRAFGLRNRAGLADFLEGGGARLAHCAENLSVLVAGRSAEDPLELLGRPRMRELLAAAARRYRAVLVDTPSAACGPDLQLPAAFSGGALVVAGFADEVPALERLREQLAACKARVVGTVLDRA
jgi:Mrp family chromosome partitioning ATPase